jgi:DNA polymerase (family X)
LQNQEIIDQLKLASMLMELHEENAFKIRGYQNAVFNLDKVNVGLANLSIEELTALEGIGKGIAAKIHELNTTNQFAELNELLEKTPKGIIEMLNIKGIGPKKVRTIWKDLQIENKEALLLACNENKISTLKGFGEKTQEAIKQALVFTEAHKEKFLYAEIEEAALQLEQDIKTLHIPELVSLSGEIRRKLEVVNTIQLIIGHDDPVKFLKELEKISCLQKDEKISAPFAWRGAGPGGIKTEIRICAKEDFTNYLYIHSASEEHLKAEAKDGKSFFTILKSEKFNSEEDLYKSFGLQYIEPEMREGLGEVELAREHKIPALITNADLKGILHNHSTYSDGSNTLEEMAVYCKELGYEYLGISDHSKTAFYANGLKEFKVLEQHKEIDLLNKKLAPFRIFKGIESDILNDGELDYEDEILASFDFIVASIHSNLKMTEEKATARLIKAIENPYTTMLGHATGRLLLKREAYPIDHRKIIDACVANHVSIEINANPRRLDMDWRWVRYAIEKGIMISINPDAHNTEGYHDMKYGVYMGRKAGLSKELTFNALSLAEIEKHFIAKKKSNSLKV